jgi:23S rRNA (adenine2030-N6)-methyltransferase
MNYRHAFHAGNFADVVKHAVLARVIAHLRKKEAPFRVIDTHAGAGLFDLSSDEARRGGEWQDGIGRVWQHAFASEAATLLAPYLEAMAAFNPGGALTHYPGSPLLVQQWLRDQDRLIACELEPGAARLLTRNLAGDNRLKAIIIDGWTGLNAFIPPKEKRGLILIDPPFEQDNEWQRLVEAVGSAHRKWPTGTLLVWYPIKDQREVARFVRALAALQLPKSLRMELFRSKDTGGKLRGTGLIAINAPFTLESEAQILLPALSAAFWPGERTQIFIGALTAT